MRFGILSVKFHDFQEIKIQNNVILAKCNCCSPFRFAVFVAIDGDRNFYYHGYDSQFAQKLFSQLINSHQA